MATFGTRNYEPVDRFSRFMHGFVERQGKVNRELAQMAYAERERQAIGGILQPIREALREEDVSAGTVTPGGVTPGTTSASGASQAISPPLASAAPMTGTGIASMLGTPKADLSVAARHNNPGNLKFAPWMKKYGAVPGEPGSDGGFFAKFPSTEHGLTAMSELLQGGKYGPMDTESALRTYSGKGYGAEIYPQIRGKKMGELTDTESEELMRRIVEREGFHVGEKQMGMDELQGKGGGILSQPGGMVPSAAPAPIDMTATRRTPDLNKMTFEGMINLLAHGTEQSRQTAETLARFRAQRNLGGMGAEKPIEQYLGSEDVAQGGRTKRADVYGYIDAQGNRVITNRKYQDFTAPGAGGASTALRREQEGVQKQKDLWNQSNQAVRGLVNTWGEAQLKQWAALLEREQPNIFQLAMSQADPAELAAAIAQVADPVLRNKLSAASEYVKNESKSKGYLQSIYDRGYDIDPQTGQLIEQKRGQGMIGGQRYLDEARQYLLDSGINPDMPSEADSAKSNLEIFLENNQDF